MLETRSMRGMPDPSWQTSSNYGSKISHQMAGLNIRYGKAGQDDVCYVVAKYDYEHQGPQELDLRKNERYVLLDDSKHWWKVQNSRNQAGYVPSNYVKKEKPSLFDSIKKKVGTSIAVKKGSGSKTLPSNNSPSRTVESPNMARRAAADPSEAIGIAVVKYNYQAQQPDELSLVKGSRILILEKSNDGWWRGQSSNITGWFPSNYTQEEGDLDDTMHTYAMAENVLDIVVALYSFSSSNEQELSFEKGDRLEILDRPPSDPEWYKARNSQGQVGLVPRNYLQELSDYMDRPYQERNKQELMDSSMVSSQVSQASMMDKPHLVDKPWYYGTISRNVCDNLLNQFGHDGDFLIRDSETNVGDYSVSLKAPGRNKHFRVHVEGALYCIGQRKFHTLDQLVDHYQRAPIYTNKQGEKLYLVRPLPKTK
ncbi:cytoplasmic protein NCK1 isoform X1 [Sitophilus oryzae]|uniref:Cytoplasmic protein NCK1 isoform X1 n=1 Tax=Sitophilus oryzae TaxID=7048 RepID=A0A6J2X9V5_SITOR|nr:cytoplasmic protein NCK1 isoform X1 [Sitophilus oryzae]XP_030748006.1 cytoplasmic protein NCK1 isoform X1 [Sitophilus oryzae]XP_030748007.1 cytoplasmic protein NCK1 isoform X1 [Sitophilus oryzae]XP_030748008.1 cytoplasmic protein NCK1 isoform X1 [Sitophilus oryzae]XP_030748009.1 cytoplasmic protein NCK1 isoform X1 [Sitophilus oryzae]